MKCRTSWKYVAGFVDGEGHLSIREYDNRKYKGSHPSHGVRGTIEFSQSKKQNKVMYVISEFLNKHGIQHCLYNVDRKDSCTMTIIKVGHKKHMETFLNGAMKFMIVKREIAEKIMKFCKGKLS